MIPWYWSNSPNIWEENDREWNSMSAGGSKLKIHTHNCSISQTQGNKRVRSKRMSAANQSSQLRQILSFKPPSYVKSLLDKKECPQKNQNPMKTNKISRDNTFHLGKNARKGLRPTHELTSTTIRHEQWRRLIRTIQTSRIPPSPPPSRSLIESPPTENSIV